MDFTATALTFGQFGLGGILLRTGAALLFGLGVALLHQVRNRCSKNFLVTLALLPALVQIVIMLVNGNIGAGVAVAGAFSLVRFRSIPGGARDIGSIFFAMAMGFVTGMGYFVYGAVLLAVIGAAQMALVLSRFGEGRPGLRVLKIIIPENLDYEGLFDDIFARHTQGAELEKVRTTDLGSLYELTYRLELKAQTLPKAFLDELRCRNGNLNISLGREYGPAEEL
jgi:hypothetical protein